jgi:hypothetical protein
VVGFVAQGVGEGLGGMPMSDGVTRTVQEDVDVAQRQRTVGLTEERQAHGPKRSAGELGRSFGRGRQGLFERDGPASPATCPDAGRANLIVDFCDVVQESPALEADADEQPIQLGDAFAQAILSCEKTLQTGVWATTGPNAQGDQVAAVDVQDVRREVGHDEHLNDLTLSVVIWVLIAGEPDPMWNHHPSGV